MGQSQRQLQILNILTEKNEVSVEELSDIFSVSPSTIRRELNTLSKSGLLIRTHGGAKHQPFYDNEPILHSKRRHFHENEKQEIARISAELIEDNDIVLLHCSSITDLIPDYLTSKNVTIATNSLNIAWKLKDNDNCQLLLLGGIYFRSAESIEGNITIDQINSMHFHKTFFGSDGVDYKMGISTKTEFELSSKQAAIQCSDKSYLLCEHQKFHKSSIFKIADLSDINYIITDSQLDIETKKHFEEKCKIIIPE